MIEHGYSPLGLEQIFVSKYVCVFVLGWLVGWMIGWLVKPVQRRVVSEEVLAGTEIPRRWEKPRGHTDRYLTLHSHRQNEFLIKVGSD